MRRGVQGETAAYPRGFRCFVFLAALSSDMAAKYFAESHLALLSAGQQPAFPSLRLYHNYGITFSLFENYPPLIPAIPLLGIAALLFLCVKSGTIRRMLGAAFLFAGAAGNLISRLMYGYVIDWIYVGGYINLADIWLCVGSLMIFIQFMRCRM
jgi:signal peptidase II